jgi:hypothetical protein
MHRSRFASDVAALVSYGGPEAKMLRVDARDVDVREGTMAVKVLDVRPNAVQVELPPEHQRGRMVWLPRALVLDCPAEGTPPSSGPVAKDTADPADILRALALERWSERNGGRIVAVVETTRISADSCAYFFTFTVPALDGYRLRLFRIEHGADHYPVRIIRGEAAEEVLEVSDDHSFYDAARRILDGPATAEILRQLRSMIAERIPKSEGAQVRVALPSAAAKDEDGPEEEETRIYTGRSRRRPTLLGGLAGGPQAHKASKGDSSPTLVSPGNERPSDGPDDDDDGSTMIGFQRDDGSPISDVPDSDE